MLCENCGKNKANVKYTQIIDGNKKEVMLCEECSQKFGLDDISFNMPINFSSFFSDFIDEFEDSAFLPSINSIRQLRCDNCNLTFEEFMNNGKFGCSNCYDIFEPKLDALLKNIQGSDRHIGRLGMINKEKSDDNNERISKDKNKSNENLNQNKIDIQNSKDVQENKKEKLQKELNQAIKEERYEDAAKIRDEIKKYINGDGLC